MGVMTTSRNGKQEGLGTFAMSRNRKQEGLGTWNLSNDMAASILYRVEIASPRKLLVCTVCIEGSHKNRPEKFPWQCLPRFMLAL